ncbi:MAG: GDSL-type esterase/lipase family protein [Gammaproteobacteria bacterium]
MLVCTGLLAACSESPSLERLPTDAVILAFGDSLTDGAGASQGDSYPAVLEGLTGMKVVNGGVRGEVSEEGRERLPELLERYQPNLVILCHGGNDLLRKRSVTELEQNLSTMVRAIQESGAQVLLIAVPEPGLWLSPPDLYGRVAATANIPIMNEELSELESDNSMKSDLIHLNARGYRELAVAVRQALVLAGAL